MAAANQSRGPAAPPPARVTSPGTAQQTPPAPPIAEHALTARWVASSLASESDYAKPTADRSKAELEGAVRDVEALKAQLQAAKREGEALRAEAARLSGELIARSGALRARSTERAAERELAHTRDAFQRTAEHAAAQWSLARDIASAVLSRSRGLPPQQQQQQQSPSPPPQPPQPAAGQQRQPQTPRQQQARPTTIVPRAACMVHEVVQWRQWCGDKGAADALDCASGAIAGALSHAGNVSQALYAVAAAWDLALLAPTAPAANPAEKVADAAGPRLVAPAPLTPIENTPEGRYARTLRAALWESFWAAVTAVCSSIGGEFAAEPGSDPSCAEALADALCYARSLGIQNKLRLQLAAQVCQFANAAVFNRLLRDETECTCSRAAELQTWLARIEACVLTDSACTPAVRRLQHAREAISLLLCGDKTMLQDEAVSRTLFPTLAAPVVCRLLKSFRPDGAEKAVDQRTIHLTTFRARKSNPIAEGLDAIKLLDGNAFIDPRSL